jgi:hypothetical protein
MGEVMSSSARNSHLFGLVTIFLMVIVASMIISSPTAVADNGTGGNPPSGGDSTITSPPPEVPAPLIGQGGITDFERLMMELMILTI